MGDGKLEEFSGRLQREWKQFRWTARIRNGRVTLHMKGTKPGCANVG